MKQVNARTAGFTLVEIMIVVAIIGLLATMAMPNFKKSREIAYTKTCLSNLTRIEGAVECWATETQKGEEQPVTYSDISSYLKNSVVCPAGGTSFQDSYNLTTVAERPTCLRKPQTHMLPAQNR